MATYSVTGFIQLSATTEVEANSYEEAKELATHELLEAFNEFISCDFFEDDITNIEITVLDYN